MKLKLPNIKSIHIGSSLRIISIIVIISVILMILIFGFFLYQYFYKTIAYSDEIILLKQEVAPESIDIKQVEKMSKNMEKKTSAGQHEASSRNPFSFGTTTLEQAPPTITQ